MSKELSELLQAAGSRHMSSMDWEKLRYSFALGLISEEHREMTLSDIKRVDRAMRKSGTHVAPVGG
jgi:hypothetical protein